MIGFLFFPFFYLYEVVIGALRIAWDVLRPSPQLSPTFLRIPVDLDSRRQRILLANLITMTPGTLAVDEFDDGKTILVHSLYAGDDPAAEIHSIKKNFESIVRRVPI